MRARNAKVLVAGLVIFAGACSDPSARDHADAESELSAELELALFGARASSPSDGGIVSELELGRPKEVEMAASPRPVEPLPTPAPPKAEPTSQIVLASRDADAGAPVDLAPVSAVGGGGDAGTGAGGADEAAGGPEVGRRGSGPRPGIIIRGGGTGHDPCVIHLPGMGPGMGTGVLTGIGDGGVGIGIGEGRDPRGTVGIAVNDQTPRGVGRDAYTAPSRGRTPSYAGGGRSFPGGIR